MPAIYPKGGWWYAPAWENPVNGERHKAHALGTQDEKDAEARWIDFQARAIAAARTRTPMRGQQLELPAARTEILISEAVEEYIRSKKDIAEETREAYRHYARLLIRPGRLEDAWISTLSGNDGTAKLQAVFEACEPIEGESERGGRRDGATLADVARRAGCSVNAVSRVVRGGGLPRERGRRVSPKLAQIQAAIAELGYEPSKPYDRCAIGRVSLCTLWKWFYCLLHPALRYAHTMKWIAEMPAFPPFTSDDDERLDHVDRELTPAEWAALRAAMPVVALVAGVKVFARDMMDVGAFTGLHPRDLVGKRAFKWEQWNRLGRKWMRINSKGRRRTFRRRNREGKGKPQAFPCDPYLQQTFERIAAERPGRPDDCVLVESREKVIAAGRAFGTALDLVFKRAARKAGLSVRPSAMWLRHYFAARRRDEGWTEDQTAKVLGNSGDIVRRVYAKVTLRGIDELVLRSKMSAETARVIDEQEKHGGPPPTRVEPEAAPVIPLRGKKGEGE